ncbi:MAG: hypothetical protein MUO30_11935 [Anaerolineales bacterium]|jgi:putative transposase|nr:hypothetical protein [Anaerolineales bacterium]
MTFDSFQDPTHLYFITATICGWRPLFANEYYASTVLGSLEWFRKQKRMLLYAFVLMPSHLHAIIKPENRTIGEVIQNFASFTAHTILQQLRKDNATELLAFFHEQKRDARHQHSIWQDVQAKNIYSEEFLEQKIEYIHQNPIHQDKNLHRRADYKYSSACFYDDGKMPVIEIDNVREYLQP